VTKQPAGLAEVLGGRNEGLARAVNVRPAFPGMGI